LIKSGSQTIWSQTGQLEGL